MGAATWAEDDLFVAGGVGAIDVVVAGGLAMEAFREDFAVFRRVDWDGDAFVENVEFSLPVTVGELLSVLVDAAVELVDVGEAFFLEKA